MISKTDIIKLAQHVVRRGRGIPDRKLMHPYREWYIGIVGALVVAGLGAAYNFYLFRYYDTLEEHTTESVNDAIEYRFETAENVRERFSARAAEFARTLEGTPAAGRAVSIEPDVTAESGDVQIAQ